MPRIIELYTGDNLALVPTGATGKYLRNIQEVRNAKSGVWHPNPLRNARTIDFNERKTIAVTLKADTPPPERYVLIERSIITDIYFNMQISQELCTNRFSL